MAGLELVDFGGEDEVGFGEAVDFVGPGSNFGFAPREQNIGMMALLLGELADSVDEVERLAEIGEGEDARDVMRVDDAPVRDLLGEFFEFFAGERRDATAAGDALLAGQVGHRVTRVKHSNRSDCTGIGALRRLAKNRPGRDAMGLRGIFCYSSGRHEPRAEFREETRWLTNFRR